MVTLAVSQSVTNNRSLVIAGYFYGLNTMFLTLRAFGHVMETTRQIGPIQIALFHILTDLVTIFWQFIAAILAFSIAITKVYVAEKSFISEDNRNDLWVNRYMVTSVVDRLFVEYVWYAINGLPHSIFWVDFWVYGLKISNFTKRKFHHVLLISFHQISFGGRWNLKGEVQKTPDMCLHKWYTLTFAYPIRVRLCNWIFLLTV